MVRLLKSLNYFLKLVGLFKLGESFPQGIKGCLGPVGQLQLVKDIANMDPDSSFLDSERPGNFLI